MSKTLAVLNMDGSIVSASSNFQTFFNIDLTKHPANIQDILSFNINDIRKNEKDNLFLAIPMKSNNGKAVDFFVHSLKDAEGKVLALILTVLDPSHLKNDIPFDDENLCHLDRLTHIGKLSANIAHEIGNPLGGILAAAHGLKKKLRNTDEREYIDMIIDDIAAIKNTIESLRDFARRSKPKIVKSDLREILKRTLFLVQPEIQKKKIQFVESFPDRPTHIKVDPEQMIDSVSETGLHSPLKSEKIKAKEFLDLLK